MCREYKLGAGRARGFGQKEGNATCTLGMGGGGDKGGGEAEKQGKKEIARGR